RQLPNKHKPLERRFWNNISGYLSLADMLMRRMPGRSANFLTRHPPKKVRSYLAIPLLLLWKRLKLGVAMLYATRSTRFRKLPVKTPNITFGAWLTMWPKKRRTGKLAKKL